MNSKRIVQGFGWGVVATIAMSVVMILGMVTGAAPMPKPIPVAIVGKVMGGAEFPQQASWHWAASVTSSTEVSGARCWRRSRVL